MEQYFIVYGTKDAPLGFDRPFTEKQISERIAENYYGQLNILSEVPSVDEDWCRKHGNMLIIKGKIVLPKPIETVVSFKFE